LSISIRRQKSALSYARNVTTGSLYEEELRYQPRQRWKIRLACKAEPI